MRVAPLVLLLLLLAPAAEAAPGLRGQLPFGARSAVVSLRTPDGWQRFRVHRQAVMAPGRARRRSRFRGFAGRGVDDRRATVRLDTSVLGLHASVRSPAGTVYLGGPVGTVPALPAEGPIRRAPGLRRAPRALRAPGDQVVRRTYRLALASDPSYAAAVASPVSNAAVTAAKQTLVARLDQVYEEELGITLELIGTPLNFNSAAAFSAAPYTADECDGLALDENQDVIDAKVGSANYDIGHLMFGPDGDGGGIAALGAVGRNGVKAQGCTGLASPVGDAFAIDYVAHEMGHQFGGSHTFNGTSGSCSGGTRSSGNAVEPGSGSSIMAYAGICGSDNLQDHSDPYFSQRSIQQIQAYVSAGGSQGGAAVVSDDRSPVVTAPEALTIPIRTPFTLAGSATDADADPLVYTWEQNDAGSAAGLQSNTKLSGALFRQFSQRATALDTGSYPEPGENTATAAGASRTFPDAAQIAAGATNILTGNCSSLDCFSEFLPTTARTLHFRLTARDLRGGASSDDTTVTVAGTAPFQVTSQGAAATVAGGDAMTVTWDPAGTAGPPFGVTQVRIAFSADGGLTFPFTAAANTPNDGSETITVPNLTTTAGRVRVAALGQPFFSMNRGVLTISAGAGPTVTPDPEEPTPTPSPSPSPTPEPTAVTPTPTPGDYMLPPPPTPSPSPAPTVRPDENAFLRPVVAGTRRRLRVSRTRRVKVVLRCEKVGAGAAPDRCQGTLRLLGRRRRFSIPVGATVTRRLRISRRAFARLPLRTRLSAAVGQQTASKRVILRRRAA